MKLTLNTITTCENKQMHLTIYSLMAFAFIFIANDNTLRFLLNNPTFYTDILFSILTTFSVGLYLKYLNTKLNENYSWYKSFKTRLVKQVTLGISLPFVLAMLLEVIYLKTINIEFFESSMLNFEMPLAFIFLILLNLISLTSYLFGHKKKETLIIKEQVIVNPPECLKGMALRHM